MSPGVPDGQTVVLDVAQLQALLAKTFNVGSARAVSGLLELAKVSAAAGRTGEADLN